MNIYLFLHIIIFAAAVCCTSTITLGHVINQPTPQNGYSELSITVV